MLSGERGMSRAVLKIAWQALRTQAVSRDTEFKWVTSQIEAHKELRDNTFKMFVQTFSAIAAGTIWLSFQPNGGVKALPPLENIRFAALTDSAAVLLAAVSAVMLWESWHGWRSYRLAQSTILPHVRKPKWRAFIAWAMMGLTIIVGTCLFWLFNPFGIITPGRILALISN